MPAGNGTGPNGAGPMTGRGAGFCAGSGVPGYARSVAGGGRGRGMGLRQGFGGHAGRGMGMGFGRGRPCGGGYGISAIAAAPAPTREQQLEMLKNQAEHFENALVDLRKGIAEIESGNV
jgi:hypothetical protein